MGFELNEKQKKAVVESLEKNEATTKTVNASLTKQNLDVKNKWNEGSYTIHKQTFEKEYYPNWREREEQKYKEKLQDIDKVEVTGALKTDFTEQAEPGQRCFWKTRRNENNKIADYKSKYPNAKVNFDKNTVREMSALKKYQKYHETYFDSRNHQKKLYDDYTDLAFADMMKQNWKKNIGIQRGKFGKFFGSITGSLETLKDTIMTKMFGEGEELTNLSHKDEMDNGLRPFMVMTKKTLFWKRQVGLLGTETDVERKDGSEYSKALLRTYTTGEPQAKVKMLDGLAEKLIKFKLRPEMLTNKYMAKNMLTMQRYTDMLNGFVTLIKYNPDYLDVKNDKVKHTSPEMSALIRSRIILMAPIMTDFMEKHAKYYGYTKQKGVEGISEIDATDSKFANKEAYDEYVAKTWKMLKAAYNSSGEFLDDFADVKMAPVLQNLEADAISARRERNKGKENTDQDDSEFDIKFDVTGEKAKKLLGIKNKIASNPYVYEIFGGDLDRMFNKVNEMTRRLDEIESRKNEIDKLIGTADTEEFKLEDFKDAWKTHLNKEKVRIQSERTILDEQLKNYEEAINYLVDQKIDSKDLKLAEPSENVKNVIKFEGMDHIYKIKEAFEYNDMFYKAVGAYDFNKFTNFKDAKGNVVEIKDLWAQYNFTLLKRGMDRVRLVNRLVDGKTTANIAEIKDLNNIERRAVCQMKFADAEKTIEQLRAAKDAEIKRRKEAEKAGEKVDGELDDVEVTVTLRDVKEGEQPKDGDTKKLKLSDLSKYEYSLKEMVTLDIDNLIEQFQLTKELDITNDETYEKYFRAKSIAEIGKKLENDPSGKSVPGYNELTRDEQVELQIRSALFKDFFNTWDGQMTYTRTEAYEFLGDIANMQGNNAIIEGINRNYRKSAFTDIKEKLKKNTENETDEKKKEQAKSITTFLDGMEIANEYQTKEIKSFNRDAYVAYKAKYELKLVRQNIEKTYNEDFDLLVKKGLAEEKDRKKYMERAETAIKLKYGYETYMAKEEEILKKRFGKDHPTAKNVERKNFLKLHMHYKVHEKKEKDKDAGKFDPTKDYELTEKEKQPYLKEFYHKYTDIVNKMDAKYCSDEYIVDHLDDVLADIKYCSDFIELIKEDDGKNYIALCKVEDISEEAAADLARAESKVTYMRMYVNATMYDYGIDAYRNTAFIKSRQSLKRDIISTETKYSKELEEAKKESVRIVKEERERIKEDKRIKEEYDKQYELWRAEEEKIKVEREKEYEAYKKAEEKRTKNTKEEKTGTKILVFKGRKNPYEDYLNELRSQKRTFEDVAKVIGDLHHTKFGIFDEKVDLEENTEKGKVDYITQVKNRLREHVDKYSQKPPKAKYRNYTEELFKYLEKTIGDKGMLDEEMIIKGLQDASSTWFFLSGGAKAEARVRLEAYKRDHSVMSDYFMWKNARETQEVMKERLDVFGQKKFVKTNIAKMHKIQDVIAEVNACINDIQTPEFLDTLAQSLEIRGIDERQFMFLLRKHNVGMSGMANNLKDANSAALNKETVKKYLDFSTKDEMLIKMADDAIAAAEELDIKNINEDYIIEHFDQCFFTANKMLAFQQLYYGEIRNFQYFKEQDQYRELISKVETCFDKGRGELYGRYYSNVIAVAMKYGLSASGQFTFGLSLEEVEKLQKGEDTKELQQKVKDNLGHYDRVAKAEFEQTQKAHKTNKMSIMIEEARKDTLLGIDPEKMDTYGLDTREEHAKYQKEDLEKFYADVQEANNGANVMYNGYLESRKDKNKVTYTKETNYYVPKLMFMTAKDDSLETVKQKIDTEIATDYKNLFKKDTESIGKNLRVLDKDKCDRMLKTLKDLGLDKGVIRNADPKSKEKIFDEDFLDKHFSKEFYEDMINMMNFCVLFENDTDFLQLEAYERAVEERVREKLDEGKDIYDGYVTELRNLRNKRYDLEDKLADLERENNEILSIDREYQHGDFEKNIQLEKDIAATNKEIESLKLEISVKRTAVKQVAERFNIKDYGIVNFEKLETLRNVKNFFTNSQNRFMTSRYFELFNEYLLKNGIQIDGELMSKKIFDDIVKQRSISDELIEHSTMMDDLEMGDVQKLKLQRQFDELFEEDKKYIESGKYLKDYSKLVEDENAINKRLKEESAAYLKRVKSYEDLYNKLKTNGEKLKANKGKGLTDKEVQLIKEFSTELRTSNLPDADAVLDMGREIVDLKEHEGLKKQSADLIAKLAKVKDANYDKTKLSHAECLNIHYNIWKDMLVRHSDEKQFTKYQDFKLTDEQAESLRNRAEKVLEKDTVLKIYEGDANSPSYEDLDELERNYVLKFNKNLDTFTLKDYGKKELHNEAIKAKIKRLNKEILNMEKMKKLNAKYK